jgi:2-dehydropantoate 2-reductase
MKVSILGAGAIGSMLGGLIKHHEPRAAVLLIVRGEHGREICRHGAVKLDGPWGGRRVPIDASFDVADIADSDFIVVTVKSQDTEQALQAAQPYLGRATVVSIQNGINDEAMGRYVRPERAVMGMTATNMAILEPGAVSLQLDGTTVVGPAPDGSNAEAAREAAALLRKTGLQIDEHPNVLGVRYNKLAINAMGYASCLSASNFITEAVCFRPWRQSVGLPLVEECFAAFLQAGITLAKIPGRPDVARLRRFLRMLDVPLVGSAVGLAARRIYNKKPIVFSLYQDLRRGRTTEVDFINGQVVRLAQRHGGAAPRHALVADMVHELEQRNDACFFAREEVIERFKNLDTAR